jgi:hypothetical protein
MVMILNDLSKEINGNKNNVFGFNCRVDRGSVFPLLLGFTIEIS